jgi:hypothetical protein
MAPAFESSPWSAHGCGGLASLGALLSVIFFKVVLSRKVARDSRMTAHRGSQCC